MKSSGSDSDYNDYFSNLKKQTLAKSFDFGDLSDSHLSELIKKDEEKIKTKSKKKNKSKSKDGKLKKKKTKKENADLNNGKKSTKTTSIKKKNKPLNFDHSDSDLNNYLNDIPKLDLKELDREIGIKGSSTKYVSEEESSSFGKDGKRFLKKQKKSSPKNEVIVAESLDLNSSGLKSTLRSINSPQSKKKVTIVEDETKEDWGAVSTDYNYYSDDVSVSENLDNGSGRASNFMGMNILSFDDLVQNEDIPNEVTSDHEVDSSPIKNRERIMSIEQIMSNEESEDDVKVVKKEISYIKSVNDESSLEEILTASKKDKTSVISVPKTQRTDRLSGRSMNSVVSKEYSMTFEEDIGDADIVNNASDAIISISDEATSSSSASSDSSVQPTKKKITRAKKSKKSSSQKLKYKEETSSLQYQWDPSIDGVPYVPPSLGMRNIDPTPIAHYVISPEALENVTAYSPCMLLMTNTLRLQIEMTKNFIESQKRLYESVMNTIKPSYVYTTLEDTKKFIKSKRTKSLTMKQALKLVEEEEAG